MASENSPKGRLQIIVACGAIVAMMLLSALAIRVVGGSRGLQAPTASGSAVR